MFEKEAKERAITLVRNKMTEKELKYNEECEEDCVVHKLATHNTCVF